VPADPDRLRIERSLVEIVAEKGTAEIDLGELLERAAVDRDTFARSFSDVQDCLERTWERMTDEHVAVVESTAAAEDSWRDGLRAAAYAALRFHQEDPVRARFFLIEVLAAGEFAQRRRELMMNAFIDLVDSARRELPDPESVPRSEAEAIVGAIYQAAVAGMQGGGVEKLPELVPQLLYIAILPYKGAGAAEEELRRGPDDLIRYIASRIDRALIELVAEHGLPAVDEAMVAERAGVDLDAFERSYTDVQDCFDQVWEGLIVEYTSAWDAAFAGEGPWRDRLRAAGYFTLRYFTEDPVRTTFFMVGAQSGGEIAQARRDRMIARGIAMVDEGRLELPDPEAVPPTEAEAVVGAIYEALLGAAAGGDLERMPELVPQLMYIAVLPYKGAEAAEEELRRGPDDLVLYRRGDL
jgi:AcrR family transcriptional regulator